MVLLSWPKNSFFLGNFIFFENRFLWKDKFWKFLIFFVIWSGFHVEILEITNETCWASFIIWLYKPLDILSHKIWRISLFSHEIWRISLLFRENLKEFASLPRNLKDFTWIPRPFCLSQASELTIQIKKREKKHLHTFLCHYSYWFDFSEPLKRVSIVLGILLLFIPTNFPLDSSKTLFN